jgi:hypothetical protein
MAAQIAVLKKSEPPLLIFPAVALAAVLRKYRKTSD